MKEIEAVTPKQDKTVAERRRKQVKVFSSIIKKIVCSMKHSRQTSRGVSTINSKTNRWDIPEEDKVVFSHSFLAHELDARQYYDGILAAAKDNGTKTVWRQLVELFEVRFSSLSKQTEIFSRLKLLRLEDVREKMTMTMQHWIA